MWKIKLPDGQFLDTPDTLGLQFELNNQVFSTSSTASLPGSFSFPVDVPLTKRMTQLLKWPQRIDSAVRTRVIENVVAYAEGVPLFQGTLRVKQANKSSVKLELYASPVSALKTKKLTELDFEGSRTVAPTSWTDYMLDTANNPEDYDHAFFYVFNEGANLPFNVWDDIAENFVTTDSIISPFVRLKYLLDRMFELTGYQFSNDWQSDDLELGRLYVFNNVDVRVLAEADPHDPELPDSFELNKHLPPIISAEFLKKLMAQWGLGLFTNIFKQKIALIPLRDILKRAPKHDWTNYAVDDLVVDTDESFNAPGYYNYAQPNAIPPYAPPVEDATLVRTTLEVYDNLPMDPGHYYIETNSNYLEFRTGNFGDRLALCHRGVRVGEGEAYEAGMEGLFDFISGHFWNGPYSGWVDDDGYKWEQNDFPTALMFYRGLQDCIIGANRSTLNGNSVWLDGVGSPNTKAKLVTNGVEEGEATQSLNWFGEYGLYEKYHKQWSETLRNNVHGTQSFILPIGQVTEFSFEDKVRVGNMDFFIKRLRIKQLYNGQKMLVEASMVSVI